MKATDENLVNLFLEWTVSPQLLSQGVGGMKNIYACPKVAPLAISHAYKDEKGKTVESFCLRHVLQFFPLVLSVPKLARFTNHFVGL